jgi:hypothetical protein
MANCCVCGSVLGDSYIITQTNIGPLCESCFDLRDRKGFLDSLKEGEDTK